MKFNKNNIITFITIILLFALMLTVNILFIRSNIINSYLIELIILSIPFLLIFCFTYLSNCLVKKDDENITDLYETFNKERMKNDLPLCTDTLKVEGML
ncbi:hypothetical protein FACS189459_5560 [Bacilli bacterium]|nr:hypothetical protein FACS189459_5560 [Bacilli bacterium]